MGAEFIKRLIDPRKFPQRLPTTERGVKKGHEKYFSECPEKGDRLLKSGRKGVKKTENVTVKVTKSVAAVRCLKLELVGTELTRGHFGEAKHNLVEHN
jgi:hypothetical protein